MSEAYYPPGTFMGPPRSECELVMVWLKGFSVPLVGEIGRSDIRHFEPSLCFCEKVHEDWQPSRFWTSAEDIIAWLPLVPTEGGSQLVKEGPAMLECLREFLLLQSVMGYEAAPFSSARAIVGRIEKAIATLGQSQ